MIAQSSCRKISWLSGMVAGEIFEITYITLRIKTCIHSLMFQRIWESKGGRTAPWLGSTEMPGVTPCAPPEPVVPRHTSCDCPPTQSLLSPRKKLPAGHGSPRLSGTGATHTLICSLGTVYAGLCCPGCTFRCSSLPVPVSLPEVDNPSVGVSTDCGICFLWFDWLFPGCVGYLVSQLVWGVLRCKIYEKCQIRDNFQTILSLGRQGLQASINRLNGTI